MTNKFKVLKHNRIFVNETMLGNGIYEILTPTLYSSDHSIEKLIKTFKDLQPYSGMSDEYIKAVEDNLMKCRFVDVELIELKQFEA